MILLLYVDDLLLTGEEEIIGGKEKTCWIFQDEIPRYEHYFLGMEVWQSADGIFLGQGKYALEILKRFEMLDCKAITTPMASNLKLLSDASSESIDATM